MLTSTATRLFFGSLESSTTYLTSDEQQVDILVEGLAPPELGPDKKMITTLYIQLITRRKRPDAEELRRFLTAVAM